MYLLDGIIKIHLNHDYDWRYLKFYNYLIYRFKFNIKNYIFTKLVKFKYLKIF